MGDGGLGLAQQAGYITNAQFILRKGIEDLGARRVPENLECLGQFLNHAIRLHHLSDSRHLLLVDAKYIARLLFALISHVDSF
jgi:hypothetical protein